MKQSDKMTASEYIKRRPASMFKRFFVFTAITVLFCLLVSYLLLTFFFVNMWGKDRTNALVSEVLSLARSVDAYYDDQLSDGLNDSNAIDSVKMVARALLSVEGSSDSEVYIVSKDGHILLCKDKIREQNENIGLVPVCVLHSEVQVENTVLLQAQANGLKPFEHDGVLFYSDDTEYLAAIFPYHSAKGSLDFYLISTMPTAQAYLPYTTDVVRLLIITAAFALVITFIASLAVSYRMVSPLKKITAVTKEYAGGDFSKRIGSEETYKELEDLLISFNSMADSLSVLEESRSSFVANISHELKTPMTVIQGFIDGILDGTIQKEDTTKYLQIVSGETKRLSRLVVAMLNMSKIQAGKLSVKPTEVRLDNMVFSVLLGFEKVIEERDIHIEGLDEMVSVPIRVDEALINQVIYNLIDNAVKFTPQGCILRLALQNEKKQQILTVYNTGKGIPPQDVDLIFDRFYKVDKSRGLDTKSFGMGLYIVKCIVELHHGSISVESKEGEFTCFTVKLPLQQD